MSYDLDYRHEHLNCVFGDRLSQRSCEYLGLRFPAFDVGVYCAVDAISPGPPHPDAVVEMGITGPLLTAREGAAVLQVSVPTFWRRVADGTVPKPVKIRALSRWPKSEISDVIERAKAKR